jgi:DNA-binding NarL/FixJ family response regulator
MDTKILMVDSFDCVSSSVGHILKKNSVIETDYVNYCDDAYLKIKRAIYDKSPYHLLICDLNFKKDSRNTKLNSGEELITAIKKLQPDINIIVFSEEMKSFRIRSLLKKFEINAFVHKRNDNIIVLEKAIEAVFVEEIKKPLLKFEDISQNTLVDLKEYELLILKLISNGYKLDKISSELKKLELKPSSESSIEKCLNKLRIHFNARNNVHLIALTKDLGLI